MQNNMYVNSCILCSIEKCIRKMDTKIRKVFTFRLKGNGIVEGHTRKFSYSCKT